MAKRQPKQSKSKKNSKATDDLSTIRQKKLKGAIVSSSAEKIKRKLIHRLSLALESSNLVVWEWTIKKNKVLWSDNAHKMFGVSKEVFEQSFENFLQHIHPDDKARISKTVEKALKQRENLLMQYRWIWPNGTVHWIESMGKLTLNKKGEPMSMTGTLRDVTDSVNLDQERQDWKTRFILVSDSAGVIIYDYNIATGNIIWSGNVQEILGYQAAELGNIDRWVELIHPNDRNEAFALLEKAQLELKPYDVTYQFQKSSGTYAYMHDRGFFLAGKNGKAVRMLGMMNDISQRKKTEEALRESEQRFRTLQQASFGGIGLHDKGILLDCNQGLCDLTGYSYEELIGSNGLNLIAPEWRSFVMDKILTGYDKTYDAEGLKKDGTRYFLEIRGKNMPFEGRHIRVTEFRDITDRKKSEEKILLQNSKLLSLTEDLIRKNNQLEEFTQIVSHNLRSPVGNISTLISFLEGTDSENEKQEFIKLLREACDTTLHMLNDLNEVLKIKQNKNIEKATLSFSQVLTQVESMLNAKVSQLSAKVVHDFSSAPSIVYPFIYLESIFLNLLDNALKYSSPGRSPEVVFKTYRNDAGHLILEAKDNGLGLNMERYGHHVFKLRKTFHHHPESRGIGLFMIKNQIEAMGGEITLSSIEGEGSTFFINFNKHQFDGY
jgi:PAS domain S-box-containing protein